MLVCSVSTLRLNKATLELLWTLSSLPWSPSKTVVPPTKKSPRAVLCSRYVTLTNETRDSGLIVFASSPLSWLLFNTPLNWLSSTLANRSMDRPLSALLNFWRRSILFPPLMSIRLSIRSWPLRLPSLPLVIFTEWRNTKKEDPIWIIILFNIQKT